MAVVADQVDGGEAHFRVVDLVDVDAALQLLVL